jgi:hypothetical protein
VEEAVERGRRRGKRGEGRGGQRGLGPGVARHAHAEAERADARVGEGGRAEDRKTTYQFFLVGSGFLGVLGLCPCVATGYKRIQSIHSTIVQHLKIR